MAESLCRQRDRRGGLDGGWEDQRVAECAGRPQRRYYELTDEGRAVLEEGASRMAWVVAELRPDAARASGCRDRTESPRP